MASRRTISLILTGFLILFLYTGSCHSFCQCFAQSCPFHVHANPLNSLWVLQAGTFTGMDQTRITSYLSLFEEDLAYAAIFLTPLKARAPPHDTIPQIIASR